MMINITVAHNDSFLHFRGPNGLFCFICRCFKCQKIPTSLVDRFLDTVMDRLRLPGIIGGGATRIDLEVATPVIMIPASLALAANGPIMTMIILTFLPYFCFFFYRTWTRKTKRPRTKFFFVWGLVSIIYMYTLFEIIICRQTNISQLDNLIISVCIFTMFMALLYAKKDPGFITYRQSMLPVYRIFDRIEDPGMAEGSDIEEGFEVIDREELKSMLVEGGKAWFLWTEFFFFYIQSILKTERHLTLYHTITTLNNPVK